MKRDTTNKTGQAILMIGLLLATLALPAWANKPLYRTVALTGEPAPGTEEGVYFLAFTTGLNHSIMQPRIDERGALTFSAFLAGPGVDGTNNVGIWSNSTGLLGMVGRSGQHAPGTPEGVNFLGLPSDYIPFPPVVGGGLAGIQGVLTGPGVDYFNDDGVWKGNAAGLVMVLREGDQAPGTANGVMFYQPGVVDVDDQGRMVVHSSLSGPGVVEENNEGMWSNHTGPMALLVREGDPAPVGEPDIYYGRASFSAPGAFQRFAVNNEGIVAVQANLADGPNVDPWSNETITILDAMTGEVEVLVREGDTAPGMGHPNITFGGGSVTLSVYSLSINDSGELAFDIELGGHIPTTPVTYTYRDGELAPFVLSGDPAPDTDANFTLLGGPMINNAGDVAITASIATGYYPPFGVWAERDRVLRKVLAPDDVAFGGMTVIGARLIAFNGDGTVMMSVSLDDPELGYRSGIALAEPDGALHLMVATGEQFRIPEPRNEERAVIRIEPGTLSETGVVGFRLDFSDGSSGHFTAAIPTFAGDSSGGPSNALLSHERRTP